MPYHKISMNKAAQWIALADEDFDAAEAMLAAGKWKYAGLPLPGRSGQNGGNRESGEGDGRIENDWRNQTMAQEDIIIRKVSRLLKDKYGAHSVYVFGSYVQGNYEKERSDLDIAVFLPQYQNLSLKQLTEITYHVQTTISSQVELHFLPVEVEPLSFSEIIIKTGLKVA